MANNSPIFTCPNDGVMINSKAGIISADEMMYAGILDASVIGEVASNSYMMKNFIFWSITPFNTSDIFVWHINANGLYRNGTNGSFGTRAVINLKPDVTVKSGNGSSTSPYVIG